MFGADWYLDKVIIDSPSLGKTWVFPCSRWLSKSKDDGKIDRDLYPQELETEEYIPCESLMYSAYAYIFWSLGLSFMQPNLWQSFC